MKLSDPSKLLNASLQITGTQASRQTFTVKYSFLEFIAPKDASPIIVYYRLQKQSTETVDRTDHYSYVRLLTHSLGSAKLA